jgi:serine/threonine-protein kinase
LGNRFRILRFHAEGALGEVFVARDDELHRDVALKRIKPEHAVDQQRRARFLVEAEITGNLEHPGVVPVHGLGSDDDGRPFYAMRFIRGETLKDAVSQFHAADASKRHPGERAVALRKLLGRFVAVCDAVAFAHSRGVIHRDLKPSNIMLGPYGETLVVDWGLAKSVGRPDTAKTDAERTFTPESGDALRSTFLGAQLGTPAFMSPEQAVGAADAVGAASDVYSLGSTLYYALTGCTAFADQDLSELLMKVARGDFLSPRTVNPRVDRALEAVCLKAMALDPAARYATPRRLADDIEHWLADEPVSAFPESAPRRAWRWVRRHRTLVASSAAALVVGLAVLAGFAAVLADKNRELNARNRALAQQRKRAEEREMLAIDAVKKFHDAVENNPELKDLPELESLRKALLKEPVDFYKKLLELLDADPDTRQATSAKGAHALLKLANLTFAFGDLADAERLCKEGVAILERLTRENSSNDGFLHGLAGGYSGIAIVQAETGRNEESRASYRTALAAHDLLARKHPSDSHFRYDLASIQNRIGALALKEGHRDEALESYRKSLDLQEHMSSGPPGKHENNDDGLFGHPSPAPAVIELSKAANHGNIGLVLRETGRLGESLESHLRGRKIAERIVQDDPTNVSARSTLASSESNLSLVYNSLKRPTDAMAALRRAVELQKELVQQHPTSLLLRSALATYQQNLGGQLVETQPTHALPVLRQSEENFERLVRARPEVPAYRNGLANTLNEIGLCLTYTRRLDEAIATFKRCLEIRERLASDERSAPDHASNLGETLNNLGWVEMARKQWNEARHYLERAVEHQRRALAKAPIHPEYRQFLKNHLGNLTLVYWNLRRPSDTARAARDLVKLGTLGPTVLYNLACRLALCVQFSDGDQKRLMEDEALGYLKQAVNAGWNNAAHTSRDADLMVLHERDDFRRLLAEMFDRTFPADPFAH